MSKEVIATIKLAPGRVGFYDPLSRIHLTIGAPVKQVYSGTNCASLRRNVKAGVIRLVSGTLGEDVPPFKVVKVGDRFKLASNAEAEMAPVYAEEKVPEQADEVKEIQDEAEKKVREELAAQETAGMAINSASTEKPLEEPSTIEEPPVKEESEPPVEEEPEAPHSKRGRKKNAAKEADK